MSSPKPKRVRCSSSIKRGGGEQEQEVLNDRFDDLPDDLVLYILSKLSHTSSRPTDFINALIACKRFNRLGKSPLVLSRASSKMLSIRAKNWSDSSHRFLKHCVNAGSVEACFFLGMIRFYCLGNRASGASLMAKAAMRSHAQALYALAIIQFNGSGGSKSDKDLRAGAALCARAAFLGHVDALRELGHCLQDGYGVRRNIPEGRRLLVQANARELATVLSPGTVSSLMAMCYCPFDSRKMTNISGRGRAQSLPVPVANPAGVGSAGSCALLSDFGCNVPAKEPHPTNRFLAEWFGLRGGLTDPVLRMCSHSGCGRPETRSHEFRRCSVCGAASYCSRGCQAHDWKLRHKWQCIPTEQWGLNNGGAAVQEQEGLVVVEGEAAGGEVAPDGMVET